MMSTAHTEPKPLLLPIDLSSNSRNTLATLVKLLAPHVPYSLEILGTMLNSNPRTITLQDIDASKVCLWSTIPLCPDVISPIELFSIVTFSHQTKQFGFFCSTDSSVSSDSPTKAEERHVKQVFEQVCDLAREAHPLYNADLSHTFRQTFGVAIDRPVIGFAAVCSRWAEVLTAVCASHGPFVRYVAPPGALVRNDDCPQTQTMEGAQLELSEIQEPDLPFVHGASRATRTDAYLLSREPYSVCLRLRRDAAMAADGELGRPVACALVHAEGAIGAVRVEEESQHQGLGKLVLCTLAKKLDFSNQGDVGLISDEHRDLGGGALGWNWMDTGAQNKAANGLFKAVVGEEMNLSCHWACIPID